MKKTELIFSLVVGSVLVLTAGCSSKSSSDSTPPADSPRDSGEVSGRSAELDLGATHGQTEGVNYAEAFQDGIKRVGEYLSWKSLEPTEGNYDFAVLDSILQETKEAGVKSNLIVVVSDAACTTPEKTDLQCTGEDFPEDITFSRHSMRWDDERMVRRLKNLFIKIIQRSDPNQLTHLFLGNETDSYIRAVREKDSIDLMPSFISLVRQVREAVETLPEPRPKFGTNFTFYAYDEFFEDVRKISQVVEVMGLNIYPTSYKSDPEWVRREPSTAVSDLISRWYRAAMDNTNGKPIAVNETGTAGEGTHGTAETQADYARAMIQFLGSNPSRIEYVNWFSMFDNPNLQSANSDISFFEKFGLQTVERRKRAAYWVWARQGS